MKRPDTIEVLFIYWVLAMALAVLMALTICAIKAPLATLASVGTLVALAVASYLIAAWRTTDD